MKALARAAAVAASAAASMIVAVGCSSSLDMAKLKQAITDKLSEVDIKTTSVTCPAERPAKKDDTFQCTVLTDTNVTVTVDVKQNDDDGHIGFEVGKQVFTSVKVVPEIENGLRQGGNSVISVSCPKGIAIADGNGTLTCTAVADDQKYTVKVPIRDGVAQLSEEEIIQQ